MVVAAIASQRMPCRSELHETLNPKKVASFTKTNREYKDHVINQRVIVSECKYFVVYRHEHSIYGRALCRENAIAFAERLAPLELAAFFNNQHSGIRGE